MVTKRGAKDGLGTLTTFQICLPGGCLIRFAPWLGTIYVLVWFWLDWVLIFSPRFGMAGLFESASPGADRLARTRGTNSEIWEAYRGTFTSAFCELSQLVARPSLRYLSVFPILCRLGVVRETLRARDGLCESTRVARVLTNHRPRSPISCDVTFLTWIARFAALPVGGEHGGTLESSPYRAR